MSKCLCDHIPEILQRIAVLEVLTAQQKKKPQCCQEPKSDQRTKTIEEREATLNARLEENNKKTALMNDLAQKLVEEMKMVDEIKPNTDITAELEEQQTTLENMDKLFKATTGFFGEMYKAVKPYYNLPELKDADKPTAILYGLEAIMQGVGEMAKNMSGLMGQK